MKQFKTSVHIVDTYLINPTNPVTVNLIGAGGTGSQVLTALARISNSLIALGHPGLHVHVFDDDIVTPANFGRQLFANAELGFCKSVALVNRINRFFGENWRAIAGKYTKKIMDSNKHDATVTISCVDTADARFEIAEILKESSAGKGNEHNKPVYWMDFGNNMHTGQVILSTVRPVTQPASKKFITVGILPLITDEFKTLLHETDEADVPSCSLAEALAKQDLFINSSLANLGASLLWSMFREGMISTRGFFLNLKEFRTQPLKIT